MISVSRKALAMLASLRLTLAALAAVAFVAFAGHGAGWPVGVWIALPFAVLFVNLMAAICQTPALRAATGLLAFHLSLAALALLVAADRLTAFYGHVEVTEGASFDPVLVQSESGPLHRLRLDEVRFIQGGFEVHYAPGMNRRETTSTVLVPSADGLLPVAVGDDTPLIAAGYRLYTSFNKGFAPVLRFTGADGVAHVGAVHLPSYPLNSHRQANEWQVPGRPQSVKLWLHIETPVYDQEGRWHFTTPDDATLVVISDGRRSELRPGDAVAVADGVLRYDGLRDWMGYTISHNPLVPWMLAAAAIGLLALAWHSATKIRATAWDAGGSS